MNEEQLSNLVLIITILYWGILIIWVGKRAFEMSKSKSDQGGGAFIAGIIVYGLIGLFIWSITSEILESSNSWVNLLIIGAHLYWSAIRD